MCGHVYNRMLSSSQNVRNICTANFAIFNCYINLISITKKTKSLSEEGSSKSLNPSESKKSKSKQYACIQVTNFKRQ